MSRVSVLRLSTDSVQDINVKKDQGHFTFPNGDSYDGGYIIVKDKRLISRQGRGIYLTADFNRYEALWMDDRMVNEVKIRHNNGTQYEGTLGIDGEMSGFGKYTFLDNSVLQATWEKNKPVADISLKDPLGMIWKGEFDGKEVSFTAGNHFWDELSPSIEQKNAKADEKPIDIGTDILS